jgi:hypothetical protein
MITFAQPIRNSKQPLTMDQIRSAAPSAFATEKYHERSERYAYIPTAAVIEHLMSNGFNVFAAGQSRTKIEDKREHTKHMIRLRANQTALAVGDIFPEIVLINSHDGSTAYNVMAGLFRLICSNGAVVADSMLASTHIKHTGKVLDEVASGAVSIVEHMPKVVDAVARWKSIKLSQDAQTAFAQAAHTVRFANAEGYTNTPIKPQQLLKPRRPEDNADDLWTVFNRVQENSLKGGLLAYNHETRRNVRTREINGIDQDVKLNRALWTLTERMAELAG